MGNPFKVIKPFVAKHEPAILTAMGVAGLLFSTFWGIKETFTVSKKIEEYKREHNLEKLTPKEYFKLSWKHYLPVAISTAVSIPCIICGNHVANKRYTALAAAYTISETALQEYREKTREIAGEKKAQQIQEAANAEVVKNTYAGGRNQIIMTNNGENLFYEPLSGRYFKSSWNDIQKAANDLNARAIGDPAGVVTLNEWFDALGLGSTDMGETLGWSLTGYSNSTLIDISISSHLTDDNVPCGAISYRTNPTMLR